MRKIHIPKHLPALILFGIILAWRFFQIRNLVLPTWVDSVHHALLVRIFLEQGALPSTWEPYIAQVPFYYHFGFHLTASLFAKLTGVTVGQAVLIVGQLWQAALAASVYILAYILWHNQKKALIAMILVGFVSQMPAYYTTWGRYTLLAGLTLLIFGMAAALSGNKGGLTFLVAATSITHFYAFLLLSLFLLIALVSSPGKRKIVVFGWTGGVLIASPWLWHVFKQVSHRSLVYVQTSTENLAYSTEYLLYLLGPTRNYALLMLALLGLTFTVARHIKTRTLTRPAIFSFLCWTLIIITLAGPWRLGPFRPDHHAVIVLFLPGAVFATEALWQLRQPAIIWGTVLIFAFWGVWETKNIINPATILANENDIAALEWIGANTPGEANFLIDVAPWSAQWRGADGGWWITPLTGRRTVLPPAAYGWGDPEKVQQIGATVAQIYGLSWITGVEYCQTLISLMTETAATHYYTRSERLGQCSALQPVYQGGDGIAIYKLTQKTIDTALNNFANIPKPNRF